jgi:choline-sulfatase
MDLHGPINPQVVHSSQLYSASTLAQFYSQAHTVGNIYYPAKDAYYDSALRHIDDQLCRIKKWLKNENEWDNTILIITADHGEALADRGIYGHPLHYMYDELVSVPLVVRVPGQHGGRVKSLFSLGWLSELIADAVGIDRPEFPCQSSRETHLNPPAEMDEEVLYADTISTEGHTVMMRQEDIKLVLHNDNFSIGSHDKVTPENRVTPEAQFELAVDPHERDPLELKHSLVETGRQFVSDPDEWFDRDTDATIDKETLDQLQQLGYSE